MLLLLSRLRLRGSDGQRQRLAHSRFWSLVLSTLYGIAIIFSAGGVWMASAMRCDESCRDNWSDGLVGEQDWRRIEDAPQWELLAWTALAILLAGCAYLLGIWLRRRLLALFSFVVQVALCFFAAWWANGRIPWSSTFLDDDVGPWLLLGLGVGVLAVVLNPPRNATPPSESAS